MSRLLTAVLVVLAASTAFSQKPHYGSFHLTAEPFLFQGKEMLLNGTTHGNLGYGFTAEWQRLAPERYQEAGLEFDWVRPKSPFEPAAVSIHFAINIHYAMLFPVINKNDWLLHAGFNIQGDFHTFYYPLWDDSHMYWTTFCGAGAQCLARKQMNERKVFFAGFSLPVLGLMSRPPTYRENKIDDSSVGSLIKQNFQDAEAAYPVNYFNPDIAAGFEMLISDRFSLAFYLHFEYIAATSSHSEKYREMREGLGIDFIF